MDKLHSIQNLPKSYHHIQKKVILLDSFLDMFSKLKKNIKLFSQRSLYFFMMASIIIDVYTFVDPMMLYLVLMMIILFQFLFVSLCHKCLYFSRG